MAYTTIAAVRSVLSAQGAADSASAASLPDQALQLAIDDTQVEVNARLAVRYDVPFDDDREGAARPVPAVVQNITRDIAAYKATLTYRRGAPIDPNDPAVLRYKAATALLGNIVKGTATLDLENSPGADQAAEVTGQVYNRNPGTMFPERALGLGPRLRPGPFAGGFGEAGTY